MVEEIKEIEPVVLELRCIECWHGEWFHNPTLEECYEQAREVGWVNPQWTYGPGIADWYCPRCSNKP